MLRVPLSEVRSAAVDHDLTNTGDALLILLNPCTEIASESSLKTEGVDVSTPPPLGGKRRKLNHEKTTKMVIYRVSSHCLAHASSYFKSIFNDTEDDAAHHAEFGKRLEISQEWDPAALLVILQIAHFQFNNIPAKISDVFFLGKLVVIADYVKCLDVLKPFTEKWLPSLGGPWKLIRPWSTLFSVPPNHVSCVTSVKATISLVFNAKSSINDLRIPFNPRILDALNTERERILKRFFGALQKALSRLTGVKDETEEEQKGRLFYLGFLADTAYKDHECHCQVKRPYDGESLSENLVNFWKRKQDIVTRYKIGMDTISDDVKNHLATMVRSMDSLDRFPGLTAGDYL